MTTIICLDERDTVKREIFIITIFSYQGWGCGGNRVMVVVVVTEK